AAPAGRQPLSTGMIVGIIAGAAALVVALLVVGICAALSSFSSRDSDLVVRAGNRNGEELPILPGRPPEKDAPPAETLGHLAQIRPPPLKEDKPPRALAG